MPSLVYGVSQSKKYLSLGKWWVGNTEIGQHSWETGVYQTVDHQKSGLYSIRGQGTRIVRNNPGEKSHSRGQRTNVLVMHRDLI